MSHTFTLITHHPTQEVASEPSLRNLASDAFRSFVRAYATHTAETKKAFHVRNLHLGHVAFAHALKVSVWLASRDKGQKETDLLPFSTSSITRVCKLPHTNTADTSATQMQEAPTTLGASGSSQERKRKRADEVASKQRNSKKQLYRGAHQAAKH